MRAQTRKSSIVIALVLPVLVLAISWGAACLEPLPSLTTESMDLAAQASLGVAAALGTVYGLVLAAVIFTIQVHRQDDGGFMVIYLLRENWVNWGLGLLAGLIILSLSGPILHALSVSLSFVLLLIADAVLASLAVGWSLWLLASTIRYSGRRPFDAALDSFRLHVAFAVAIDEYVAELQDQFEKWGQRYGVEVQPWAGVFTRREHQPTIEFSVRPDRYVADAHPKALQRLAGIVDKHLPRWEAYVALQPGDSTTSQPALVLLGPDSQSASGGGRQGARAGTSSSGDEEIPKIAPATGRRIRRELKRVFAFGPEPQGQADVNRFYEQLGEQLARSAMQGDDLRLKQILGRLRTIARDWSRISKAGDPGAVPPWFRSSSQRFSGPLGFEPRQVVAKAVRSGDSSTAHEVVMFLAGCFADAVQLRNARMAYAAGDLLWVSYVDAARRGSVADQVASDIDTFLGTFGHMFESLHRPYTRTDQNATAEAYREEQPLVDQYLSVGLRLIKLAMERGRAQDAGQFFERLFERQLEHDGIEERGSKRAPSDETADLIFEYAMVLVAGWAVKILRGDERFPRAAARYVLHLAASRAPQRHQLVALWEFYR